MALAQESQKLGITLIEHVENLIMNRYNVNSKLKEEIAQLKMSLNENEETISFYENDFLNGLFEKYNSKTVDFINAK